MSTTPNKDKNKAMFMHLVMMMSSSALQHMGKTVNPLTGKTAIDMEGAAFAIDMLEMIENRTAGNRDPEEDRLIQSQLAALRLNFVETRDQAQKSGDTKTATDPAEPKPAASGGDDKPDETPPVSAKNGGDKNKPRFHKSYG